MDTSTAQKARKSASPGIADAAVRRATGKGWDHWFSVLDGFGAKEKGHTASAAFLAKEKRVPGWWAQMITVGWERVHGGRKVGESAAGGFELSVSRTIGAPARKAFAAWAKAPLLSKWFAAETRQDFRVGGRYANADGDRGTFTKIVPGKFVRFTWRHPKHGTGSVVAVDIVPKGPRACTVLLTQVRLRSKRERDDFKQGWSWALDSLKSFLETGRSAAYETSRASRRAAR